VFENSLVNVPHCPVDRSGTDQPSSPCKADDIYQQRKTLLSADVWDRLLD